MPTETTPLYSGTNTMGQATTAATDSNSNQGFDSSKLAENVSQFARSTFNKENLEAAAQFTKDTAIEIKKQAQDGDQSLRFLAFVGGLACTVVGLIAMVSRFTTFDIVGSIIDFYLIVLGIIVIILEGKNMILPKQFVARIHKYALFLKFLWGRGVLYFICGTLFLYQFDLLNLIVGLYMCFVGVLYIVIGHRAANKLKTLRTSIYSEQTLRSKYESANIEGNGLNLVQFRSLCQQLGLDISLRETEAAFGYIQSKANKDCGEKLSFEDFKDWWNDVDEPEELLFPNSDSYNFL